MSPDLLALCSQAWYPSTMRKIITLALIATLSGCDTCIEHEPIFVEGQVEPVCLFGSTAIGGTAGWRCVCPIY